MHEGRRDFLKRTAAGLAGLAGAGIVGGCPRKAETAAPPVSSTSPVTPGPVAGGVPVAHLTHGGVWSAPGQLSRGVVLQMIDAGVKAVTGAESAEAGWQSLFATDDVVAIKVNQISGSVFTNPVVALAIAERLMDLGLRPGSLIVWDRKGGELARNGYTLEEDPSKVVVRGVDGEWDDTPTRQGAFNGRLAKIVTRQCSALINVPVLKQHGGAAVTLAMKNHYGSFDNPSQHHGNQCDPYIADLNSIAAIKDKTRLIICDATYACFNGGPQADNPNDRWQPDAILVATDPVAHDAYGTHVLDAKRAEKGLGPLAPKQLASAASRGLGTNDLGRISVLENRLA
jgi:uncharacterized protein (DUF362 family)